MKLSQKIVDYGSKLMNPFAYFGQWNKKIVTHSVSADTKFKVRVNTSDKICIWDVWKKKHYSADGFEINPTDVVVDIGAHIGSFTVFAAKKAMNGRVFAFEPYKETYDLLVQNITLNNLTNVNLSNIAVSNKETVKKLFVGEGNIGGSSFYKKTYSKQTVDVSTISPEEIFIKNNLERMNFLKMDVEGAEYDILLNASSEILKKIDKIIIEFHDNVPHGHDYKELKDYLENEGFHVEVPTSFIERGILRMGILRAKHQ